MRRLLVTFLVLILLIVGAWAVGYMQPLDHTATYTAILPANQDAVWERIANVEAQPGWRKGLVVQPAPPENGQPCWHELVGKMPVLMCVEASTPPKLRAVALSSPGNLRGTWTYQLESISPTQTSVHMTETVIIERSSWRFLMLFLGPNFMSRQVVKQLAESFGGKPVAVR